MTAIAALSTQFLWVPVRADHPLTGDIDITNTDVEIAVVAGTPDEADWNDGTWEASADTVNGIDYHLAKLKVGPAGSGALTVGTLNVWVRITTADETPVIKAGTVTVY